MSERFYDLDLDTHPGRVFTPRPRTEPLVAQALALIGDRPVRVADVGTGAGTIAVAVAVNAPRAEVWASDVSADAVALATRNAERHGVGDRVHVRRGDLLAPLPGAFDLVLANLPYISDTRTLPQYDHEPAEAVYAPGDGLSLYRRLLAELPERLRPGGHVVLQFVSAIFAAGRAEAGDLLGRLEEAEPELLAAFETALIDSSVNT